MLQKLLTIAAAITIVGFFFFRPQLRRLGQRIDRLVTVLAWVVTVTWFCQLGYVLLTRR